MGAVPVRPKDDADTISRALAVEGGYLIVHEGSYTLAFGHGARLTGYAVERLEAACIAAGLPVIDTRMLAPGAAFRLAAGSPMIAVNEASDPPPWDSITWAHLRHVAGLYRAAGAEVSNLPEAEDAAVERAKE